MKAPLNSLLALTVLALVAGGGSIRAEGKYSTPLPEQQKDHATPKHAERQKDNLKQLAQTLNLTKEQRSKMAELHKKEAEQLKALRGDATLSQKQNFAVQNCGNLL